jgi:hypothetical protein
LKLSENDNYKKYEFLIGMPEKLKQKVNEHLALGWELHGDTRILRDEGRYDVPVMYQVMTWNLRREPPKGY